MLAFTPSPASRKSSSLAPHRTAPAPRKSSSLAPMADYDRSFKILLVGDAGVGKSSLLLRFTDDAFDDALESTVGVDFKVKMVTADAGQRVSGGPPIAIRPPSARPPSSLVSDHAGRRRGVGKLGRLAPLLFLRQRRLRGFATLGGTNFSGIRDPYAGDAQHVAVRRQRSVYMIVARDKVWAL